MNELASAVPWLGSRNPQAARWLIVIVAVYMLYRTASELGWI